MASTPRIPREPSFGVWTDASVLAAWLNAQGYTLDEAEGVRVVAHLGDDTREYVEAGGRALLVATEPGGVPGLPDIKVEARRGTPRSGNWASSFAWMRPGVTRLPGGPLLDFTWCGVIPHYVVTGVPAVRTLAGLFAGWVHMPAALVARVPIGDGRLTLATFPVLPPDDTPVRTILLHDLIRAAGAAST